MMKKSFGDLTREEVKAIFRAQRAGYERMERDRLREKWREPTVEEKMAFDAFMDDVLKTPRPPRNYDTGLVEWYRLLMRKAS